MIPLKWMQLRGFRSFADDTRVEFPKNGLVLIRGDSGSGKSSLLLALAYVFDILPKGFPATELQSWYSDKPMQVDVCIEVAGKDVILGKGKKNFVKYDDRTVTGAKGITEEHQKLFGMGTPVLGALTYRAQKTPGLFLSKTDSEKKEFLTQILGLDAIEAAVDLADVKVKDLVPRLEGARAEHISATISWEGAVEAKPKPAFHHDDEVLLNDCIADHKTKAAELESGLLSLRRRFDVSEKEGRKQREGDLEILRKKADAAKEFLQKSRDLDSQRQADFKKKTDNLQQQLRHFDATLQQFGFLQQEKTRKAGELASVKQGNCPTCSRQWDESRRKQEELEKRIAEIDGNLAGEPALKAQKFQVQNQIRELYFVADPNVEKLAGIQAKLNAEIRAIQSAQENAGDVRTLEMIRVAEQELHKVQMAQNMAQSQLDMAKLQVSSFERETQQWKLRVAEGERRIAEAKTNIDFYQSELGAERDFMGVMGREGFLGVIFEEVLHEIADEANSRLARLANVSHVSIGFRTEVLTQTKGTVRRAITTVVNVSGRECRMETGLSGGMQTSVEQIVDLAVMTVVQRRTGKIPGWLCLDEIFDGQPMTTKETAMEVLREFADDKLVLVVDHGSEFKEMFTSFIDVVHAEGKSSIV